MGSHSSSHIDCELVKVFATNKEDIHDYCNASDQILFLEPIYDSFCDSLRNCLEFIDVGNIIGKIYDRTLMKFLFWDLWVLLTFLRIYVLL